MSGLSNLSLFKKAYMDYFTSDIHFGEDKLQQYHRPELGTPEEARQTLLDNFSFLKKRDRLFILGDLGYGRKEVKTFLEPLLKKKVRVIWVRGNHDKADKWNVKSYIEPQYLKYLTQCEHLYVKHQEIGNKWYHPLYLSHYPHVIWDKSHYGECYHLYGHSHKDTSDVPWTKAIMQSNSLNVNIELHKYKPWSRDEIEEALKDKSPNLDYYLCKGNEEQKLLAKECCKEVAIIMKNFYNNIKKVEGYNLNDNTYRETEEDL